MENKFRINKRLFMLLILGILLCSVCMGNAGMTVRAEAQEEMQTFIIDAQMLPSDKSAYEIQLKVENQGQDWEGTVRLRMKDGYGGLYDSVYDTELSLPQGSTKQFVVRIPKDSLDRTDGMVQIILLDQNGGVAEQREFGRLLQAEADALTMGILSDQYMSLTYLDMGGSELYNSGRTYPIKLEEMNPDKLEESLDAFCFLVIDSYNTGILSDQALENIRQWRDQGGVLLLGTGDHAKEVLAGFDDLGMRCARVNDPGVGTYSFSDYVDASQLHMAELTDTGGSYQEGYGTFGLMCSWGDGAVGILPYSLAEVAQVSAAGDYEQQKSFVERMLLQAVSYSNFSVRSGQSTYKSRSLSEGLCSLLGNGSLKFGILKLIVILYVIFVGPILYLILRMAKKRELYWIAVPITTLVGIFLIYWAGRGFEVASTKVYSITIADISDSGNARTYLRCYDAGHKEWELRMAEGCEYVGPVENSYYWSDDDSYYYHIRKEGDRLFFGLNPSVGFEDGYFQAGIVREPEKGDIYSDLQVNLQADGEWMIGGTVTNETGWDFSYFALDIGDEVYIYKNLPAESAVNLEEAEMVYHDDSDSLGYGIFRLIQDGETEKDADTLRALVMGISFAYSAEDPYGVVIVGVTEDWDKVVDDNCSEVSYGCLYAVQ